MNEKQKITLHLREAMDLTSRSLEELDKEKVSWGDLEMAIEDAADELTNALTLAFMAEGEEE